MRVITHCPSCQTQFFATEEQLNKHGGKVRCGQCMHVFDARAQLITITEGAENTSDGSISFKDNTSSADVAIPVQSLPQSELPQNSSEESASTNNVTNSAAQQPSYLDDAVLSDPVKKNKISTKNTDKSRNWLWAFGSLLLILIAGIQSVYFLRNEIAIYYPNIKPYLLQACQQLSCSISLPKQIESIVIDDSDMQEDADHAGLVRFSSTLINNGTHVLAYPNLELTLTDVDDKPVLRRIFKPDEYLPTDTKIADGIQAGEQIRINLAITTSDTAVAGYRVFVTY